MVEFWQRRVEAKTSTKRRVGIVSHISRRGYRNATHILRRRRKRHPQDNENPTRRDEE
jgi:hypothetical protein